MSDVDTKDRPTDRMTEMQPEPQPKLPAAVALRGGGSIKAIIPQDFDQAYRMARIIAASGTAPKSYMMKDPTDLKEYLSVERIAVAIMHGLEVGLPPMQAVQGIAVINGMPTVYGDAQDALIEASGLLEDRVEEHEHDKEGLFLWYRCTVKRKGRPTPIVQEITRPQAARAGWLKKQGPWTDSPNRMAQRRARGWAYRDAFPDVLKGLVDRDEAIDMLDVTDQGSATTGEPEPTREQFKPKPQPTKVQATDVPDEDEGWPLFDETGDTVGRFPTGEWTKRLLDAAPKFEGAARAAFLENNKDSAKLIWEDDETGDIIAKAIADLYTPAEPVADDKSAPNYWHLGDSAVGEANIIKAVKEMIDGDAVTSSADVVAIVEQNGDRIKKMSAMKRDDIQRHAEARIAALAKAAA